MSTAKSKPATPAVSTAKAAPAAEEKPAPVEKPIAAAEVPARKSGLLFSVVFTVVAVLPLALSMGVIRLNASASRGTDHSATIDTELADPSLHEPLRVVDRRYGDREFLDRRYEVALHYFQSLGSNDPERLPAELLYRCALCQEGLGLWNEAMAALQRVSATTDNAVLKAAALFGQARVTLRLGEPRQAVALLRSLRLQSCSIDSLPKNMAGEIEFLIPLAISQEAAARSRRDLHGHPHRIGSVFSWPLESALAWADESLEVDNSEMAESSSENTLSIRRKKAVASTADSAAIESQIVDVNCIQRPIGQVVEALAEQFGWSVDWSELSQDQSTERMVTICATDRPVCSLLTLICSELQSTWTINANRLEISRMDPAGDHARRMIAQTLVSLLEWNPQHRLADHVRFGLAEIAQSEGHYAEAAILFSTLVGRNASPLAIRAAYNSALNYAEVGDLANACSQLSQIVDGAPEFEFHAESTILLGRMLLDRGETQAAIFQLRRAAGDANPVASQARAAVLLGVAYLSQDKYQEAAEALFAHRHQLEESTVRNAASFVTAYARWQSGSESAREREAAYLYRALTAIKSETEWLGQTAELLIGRAYSDLGLEDHMAGIYGRMLKAGVAENIQQQMTFALADYELANGRPESAEAKWRSLCTATPNRLTDKARFRLAEIAYKDGRYQECLEACEMIHQGEGVALIEIQKLMGRAFEQLGQFGIAARCYAGQYPAR